MQRNMVAILRLLLLTLQFLGPITALPMQSSESQIVMGAQSPTNPQREQDLQTSYSPDATLKSTQQHVNLPSVVRCLSADNRGDETKSYVFKSVTGKRLSNTLSMWKRGAWICREQSDLIWPRPRVVSPSEMSMDAYSESVLFWRGIAVLVITILFTISVVTLLCFK